MAEDLAFCVSLVVVLFTVCHGVSNRTVFSSTSSSGCTCDLTSNSCDVNCCCDSECSTADKEAFTFCKDADISQDDKVCVSNQLIFQQNTQFKTQPSGTGLFCIVQDNNAKRNLYSEVRTATTSAEFVSLFGSSTSYAYGTSNVPRSPYSSSSMYKAGDPVLLLFENGVTGYLAMPSAGETQECNDRNAAGFWRDASSECTRTITDLATQCSTIPTLSARSYYRGFKIAVTPGSSVNHTQTGVVSTTSSTPSVSVSISPNATVLPTSSNIDVSETTHNASQWLSVSLSQPITCRTLDGVTGPCGFNEPPDPLYSVADKTCTNVVLEVSYSIQYSNKSSTIISSVELSLVLGTLSAAENISPVQKFSVSFAKQGSGVVFRKSGNPGYIVGQPVLAGTLQIDTTAQNTQKEAILMSTDRNSWLTLARPSDAGSCVNTSERVPVTFGENMRTGCMISINSSADSSVCKLTQETALSALLGNPPTHIGSFGNSDVNKVGDWVRIINNRPTDQPDGSNGMCSNMILGVHIQILYSNFGLLANPQPKIVGVQFKYDNLKEIRYQCLGPFCQPGNSQLEQTFEVVNSVSFIDVSERPDAAMKPTPTFEAKAPSDFFYPFL